MTLSTKSTTAYVVMATWADGRILNCSFPDERQAERHRKIWQREQPEAYVRTHKLSQALPKEEK